jgi:hypothetical protein
MGIFEKNLIFMVVKWFLNWISSNEKNRMTKFNKIVKKKEVK